MLGEAPLVELPHAVSMIVRLTAATTAALRGLVFMSARLSRDGRAGADGVDDAGIPYAMSMRPAWAKRVSGTVGTAQIVTQGPTATDCAGDEAVRPGPARRSATWRVSTTHRGRDRVHAGSSALLVRVEGRGTYYAAAPERDGTLSAAA